MANSLLQITVVVNKTPAQKEILTSSSAGLFVIMLGIISFVSEKSNTKAGKCLIAITGHMADSVYYVSILCLQYPAVS